MTDSPYKYNRRTNLLSGFPFLKSDRAKFALGMAFEDIDSKARMKHLSQAESDSVSVDLSLDDVSDIEELVQAAETLLSLVRKPLKDGTPLLSDEAFALCEFAGYCRQATIAQRQAFREIGTGPLDRNLEKRRLDRCTTTSTSAGSGPEYR